MTEKELLELIRRGENQTVEFKRSLATEDKIVEELASFANTFGGAVIVGVRDKWMGEKEIRLPEERG